MKDSENKARLVFRRHLSLSIKQHHREVPYTRAGEGDPQARYYICNEYLVPFATYLPYLEATKHLSDNDVLKVTDDTLDSEGRALAYRLQTWDTDNSVYPNAFRRQCLDKCIQKLASKGLTNTEVADLLGVGVVRVERGLQPVGEPKQVKRVKSEVGPKGSRSILVPDVLKSSPYYNAIRKEAQYARRKAHSMEIASTFLLGDVLPTMYDINKIPGNGSGDLVVPVVCPVLRLRLDYDMFAEDKAQNRVRIWRKTPGPDGMAPLSYDNVIVMSAAGAWAIEGAYAKKKLAHLDDTSRTALAEWQAKYGTRTVPRETRIGRPPKGRE